MNQTEVRQFIEKYMSAFSTHIVEAHPGYLTVKLPVEVDKDIGNRPFYWSWVEKMNIPPQPMVLSFLFDEEAKPDQFRGESVHFGSRRLHQIFDSTRKHGRFVCLYEQSLHTSLQGVKPRRSTPLTPWLCINVKVSFICDKKRDCLLSLGINLHHPRIVDDFYPFLKRLTLSPAIPDYYYTLDRRLSLEAAYKMFDSKIESFIATQEQGWAEEARSRLADELEILQAYYTQLEQDEQEKKQANPQVVEAEDEYQQTTEEQMSESVEMTATYQDSTRMPVSEPDPAINVISLEEHRSGGGRILDFLRMFSVPETPKEKITQQDWKSSSPQEEKERRMSELKWQYEPRIEVNVINAGLFYLYNEPPL